MEVTETTMLSDGEADGKVTCKVVVGKWVNEIPHHMKTCPTEPFTHHSIHLECTIASYVMLATWLLRHYILLRDIPSTFTATRICKHQI